MKRLNFILLFLFTFSQRVVAQQVADVSYLPVIIHPAYLAGEGSVVFIDEGHHNFHTKDGRYTTFAKLLERDGYQVKAFKTVFEKETLASGKILVISNALNEVNVSRWILPNPSAFSDNEISVLKNWVEEGGSLFLIADHMPLAGAATDLASAFGFTFTNGFVMHNEGKIPSIFSLDSGTLLQSTITLGRDASERIDEVATFTGQAFKIPPAANAVLKFGDDHINILPDTAWRFHDDTKRQSVKGWYQLAYMKVGKGRVVMSGEAAMFSAQLAGPDKRQMGMNSPLATQNYQLLLNIIHWLDGIID
ncbi:MAG: DUF4350 domain-containing protein [Cyclobacteriaceae bacterium]|nr:DUF4350 domain-containing protein [Cyclobacteriaceae bacterium]